METRYAFSFYHGAKGFIFDVIIYDCESNDIIKLKGIWTQNYFFFDSTDFFFVLMLLLFQINFPYTYIYHTIC